MSRRRRAFTDAEIRTVAKGLVERARAAEKAGAFRVLMMPCATVCKCNADGEDDPAYCVYDTALKNAFRGGLLHRPGFVYVPTRAR